MKRAERQNAFFRPEFTKKLKRRWGAPCERETRLRILVSVAAYAYEIMDDPIMSDAKFDRLALSINLKRKTGNKEMDRWFKHNFNPYTGQWIVKHPNRKGLKRIYKMFKQWRKK